MGMVEKKMEKTVDTKTPADLTTHNSDSAEGKTYFGPCRICSIHCTIWLFGLGFGASSFGGLIASASYGNCAELYRV